MKPLRRLPPLNALRSYEAAARHLSFTKSAGELGVTPAAVSHQVKMLEEHIGVALFQRVNRQLVLTEAGEACLPGIRTAFQGLAAAINSISVAGRSGGALAISRAGSPIATVAPGAREAGAREVSTARESTRVATGGASGSR